MRRFLTGLAVVAAVLVVGCSEQGSTSWTVVDRVPHDPGSFTQGLEVIGDGVMAESSGLYGNSRVMTYRIETGETLSEADLPDDQFGEGLTQVGDRLLQGTWKEGIVHAWALPDLQPAGEIRLDGETWGLCHDEAAGIVWRSDGTGTLQGLDPGTLEEVTSVDVGLKDVNELECVNGRIWANLWHTNDVVVIDPEAGEAVGRYDLSDLVEQAESDNEGRFGSEQVLNGLAHDPETGNFYVTGKQWPWTYVVEFQ